MDQKRVKEFYDKGVHYEWERLNRHSIEFYITTRHLKPFLFDQMAIADIGGGPGRYSLYYAMQGYSVTLLDLSSENIKFARQKAEEKNIELKNFYTSSATEMPMLKDKSYDLVLCFGPMYHLKNKEEHFQVISECTRILKPDGVLAMAFLTPWAHAFSSIEDAPEKMLELQNYYFGLVDNQRNLSVQDLKFPNGWNPKPENIQGYMEGHFFKTEKIVGIETPFGRHLEKIQNELDTKVEKAWMEYIFKLSTEKSLLGACEHLLYIGRKC